MMSNEYCVMALMRLEMIIDDDTLLLVCTYSQEQPEPLTENGTKLHEDEEVFMC
jgi:hypothetical protein